jgi:hypothetical protein
MWLYGGIGATMLAFSELWRCRSRLCPLFEILVSGLVWLAVCMVTGAKQEPLNSKYWRELKHPREGSCGPDGMPSRILVQITLHLLTSLGNFPS